LPFHKTQEAQKPPLAPPIELPQTLELASIELPPALLVIPGEPIYNMREQAQPIRPPVKHRRPANPEEDANAPEAAPSPAPSVSALGELSSGDHTNLRQQTEDSIAAIERGLNGINRNLSEPEQKTAAHIREFVKQARAALASGDVEGAHTLTAKAQVLLAELTR
jgi:ribosomal protein S20